MIKNTTLTIFSILLILSSNIVNAATCSGSGIVDNAADLNSLFTACIDANAKNDSQQALNSGEFFGISTWSYLGKTDDANSDDLLDLEVDSIGDVSGTFSFDSSIWDDNYSIVIVLKGGGIGTDTNGISGSKSDRQSFFGNKGNKSESKGRRFIRNVGNRGSKGNMFGLKAAEHTDDVKWSAYLLTQDTYEGFWVYGESSNGQFKDLSHLTVYGSGGFAAIDTPATAAVPVPSAVWLFSSGLLALFSVSRRRSR